MADVPPKPTRIKRLRPNRLRGPDAPPATPIRKETVVPKLIGELLPLAMRETLPEEAQKLFVQGYNYGFEEYRDHERALHLGWAAVNRHFHQVGGQWVERTEPLTHEPPLQHGAADDVAERLKKLHHR